MKIRTLVIQALTLLSILGCQNKSSDGISASASSATEPAGQESNGGWQIARSESAMDGKIVTVEKNFSFPKNGTHVVACIQCKPADADLNISLASYGTGTAGSAFVTTSVSDLIVVAGRIRFGVDAPGMLGSIFRIDKYSNVISWNARDGFEVGHTTADLALSAFAHGMKSAVPLSDGQRNSNVGKELREHLPMTVEASNETGTVELTIPRDDRNIDELLNACSLPETKKTLSSASASNSTQGAAPIAGKNHSRAAKSGDRDVGMKKSRDVVKESVATTDKNELLANWGAQVQSRFSRAWQRPPSARPGINCTVYITQSRQGVVTDARLGTCNGDQAVRDSIKEAAYRASPLPPPPDPALFEPDLEIQFAPVD